MADKTVTVGPGRDYASLQAAITGEVAANANLVTMQGILNIVLYAFTDTTPANVAGFTTSANYYVNIYTHSSAKHNGVWNNGKYNLAYNGNVLTLSNNYTRVTGLQISVGASSDYFSHRNALLINTGVTNCTIRGNIVRSTVPPSYYGELYGIGGEYSTSGICVYNNIVYGIMSATTYTGIGITFPTSGHYIYNNTVVGCRMGINIDNYRNAIVQNNLISNCLTCFGMGPNSNWSGSGHNATDSLAWGTSYPGFTGDRLAQTFTFTDVNNYNYTLSTSDSGARGYGVDLSSDPNCPVTDDITGTIRTVPWDIGASQPEQNIGSAAFLFNLV